MSFQLPQLKYGYDALEPYIDAKTMEIHFTKHHGAYTSNLNSAITGTPAENRTIEEIMSKISSLPAAVRNNGGGFYNHNLFWELMSPMGGNSPTGKLMDAIIRDFQSFENLKIEFAKAALGRFGSGWAWLVKQENKLLITSTPNQDNPLMDVAEVKGFPLLGLDVWEHAYYLHYQNRRADYVEAFWKVVDWETVSQRF